MVSPGLGESRTDKGSIPQPAQARGIKQQDAAHSCHALGCHGVLKVPWAPGFGTTSPCMLIKCQHSGSLADPQVPLAWSHFAREKMPTLVCRHGEKLPPSPGGRPRSAEVPQGRPSLGAVSEREGTGPISRDI